MSKLFDLTPSAIATKLMTVEHYAADRAIVEAMAEKALEVTHECGSELATMIAVERAMVSAARQVLTQHDIRIRRLLNWIESDDADVDGEEETGE